MLMSARHSEMPSRRSSPGTVARRIFFTRAHALMISMSATPGDFMLVVAALALLLVLAFLGASLSLGGFFCDFAGGAAAFAAVIGGGGGGGKTPGGGAGWGACCFLLILYDEERIWAKMKE